MKKLLLTGFEPFGSYEINPSEEIAREFNNKIFDNIQIIGKTVPLRYIEIRSFITLLLEDLNPEIIIHLGQAPRSAISVERIAINLADAPEIAYNCKSKPNDEPLVKGGPAAYFSTLPIKNIVQYLKEHSIPCYVSNSAGTFGCNQIMYHTLNYLDSCSKLEKVLAGFIHIPLLPSQVVETPQSPSMDLITLKKAIMFVIEFLASYDKNEHA